MPFLIRWRTWHIWRIRTATWRRSVSPAPWSLSWIPPSLWSSPGECLEQKERWIFFPLKNYHNIEPKLGKLWKTIMELWLWWTMIVMNDCDERLCLWMAADFGLLLQSTLRWRSSKRSRKWQRSNNGVPGGQVWVAQFADLEMLCRRALHWWMTMSQDGLHWPNRRLWHHQCLSLLHQERKRRKRLFLCSEAFTKVPKSLKNRGAPAAL